MVHQLLIDFRKACHLIKMMKSRKVIWARHVAHMGEKRNVHRVLMGNLEGKSPLGRPRHRWDVLLR
jgi:hypothetical protein